MLTPPATVIPLRGRLKREETNVCESFTERALDLIAPLEPEDSRDLGEDRCPGVETLVRIGKRIQAARRLKYGI